MNSTKNYKLHRTYPERIFPILTDAYKISHHLQYPPNTQHIYSYMEPRVGGEYEDILWCGLQYILKEYGFLNTFVSREQVEEAMYICKNVFGYEYFNVVS